jgi:hypothetical protein
VRFGESALQVCEVMLKDMTDSQRIDQHVQSQKAVGHPSITVEFFTQRTELVNRSSDHYITAFLADNT